ncbi:MULTISPECIES: CtsR family transcriptional regulator [Clostridium]|uniref:Transcriptional regulator CtsR n=1 Tax=Clostridium nitritogenes TaxID=83340 RepID=A0ABP3X6S2_9CLOT|nr:CtsR family transcriptional regulator [Clostridium baratii]AQM60526.1 CtsR family transcriptional regulator [Clostridium baratii]KJU70569.1 CtsR family transcriptional regulator [Clostridium baratii]MBS6042240.1 CtsR family transcriptional regulator [Clostridium baratii]MBT9831765.1 CtsR family transcriptional regulator [Clostridium baratii]MDU1854910.1 CtsR family transcriptional regulator [Clostridium baratii]
MARLTDIIEKFIKEMIKEDEDNKVLIQRNDLADQFRCAPSQINYVLSTRFTYAKGYVIESRRGGGGYILIKKIEHETPLSRKKLIDESIGNSITYHNTVELLDNLLESELINKKEYEIIKIAVNDKTLGNAVNRNSIRADILKGMMMVIIK